MTIATDVDYNQVFLDLLGAALFPPAPAPYVSFPASTYQDNADRMLKGSTRFDYYASQANFPLIGWEVLPGISDEFWATGIREVSCRYKISFAFFHPDPDVSKQAAQRDAALVVEVFSGQWTEYTLPSGPFYYQDTATVTGRGSKTILDIWAPRPPGRLVIRDGNANAGLVTMADMTAELSIHVAA